MFKLFFVACMMALVAAEPNPVPSVFYSAYSYSSPVVAPEPVAAAYSAPLAYSAYSAPLAYSSYSAPVAYSAYSYASPYSYSYFPYRR